MSRIDTIASSTQAVRRPGRNNADLSTRVQPLASGLRIHRGKDAPAALIVGETLRTAMADIGQAIDDAHRANDAINTAEDALNEVSLLLLQLQSLIHEAANSGALSSEEIQADQVRVDAILESVNRIANTAEFSGVKLLNGHLDFQTSGVITSAIKLTRVNSAATSAGESISVSGQVAHSAEAGTVDFASSGVGTVPMTIEVDGLAASVRTGDADIALTLTRTFDRTTAAPPGSDPGGTSSLRVTGGGAKLNIGSEVSRPGQLRVRIGSINTTALGNDVVGYLSSLASGGDNSLIGGHTIAAGKVLTESIRQVATLRGRLGTFQKNFMEANTNSLSVALENVTAGESAIRDVSFASETAALTRAQILVRTNPCMLAHAISLPQNVRSVRGG